MLILSLLLVLTSPFPELKRPEIVISQGHIESGMNRFAVGKTREKGAFQVREKYWGKVPRDLKGQMLQNEDIMDELLEANDDCLETALVRYNGRGRKAREYAKKVIRGAIEVAIIGRC